ncbi:MAG: CHRD domain-containing protein [Acidobacteriia bacterium]|nr:CHRD domain-containing protein [Terriglobia bacterium]
MALKRRIAAAAMGLGFLWLGVSLAAPRDEKFHTRLAPVPMDASMRATVAGTGSATAVLTGAKLAINGTFEGLRTPATAAHLHLSRVAGVRGPAVFELTVAHTTSGAVSGSFDLSADQVDSLRKGRFYIQIQSEKAPDGNLWGWLMH